MFASATLPLSSKQANFHGKYPYGKAESGPSLARTTVVGSYKPNGIGLPNSDHHMFCPGRRVLISATLCSRRVPDFSCPVKRKQALLGSNLPTDNRIRRENDSVASGRSGAGRLSLLPGRLPLFQRSFFCLPCLENPFFSAHESSPALA